MKKIANYGLLIVLSLLLVACDRPANPPGDHPVTVIEGIVIDDPSRQRQLETVVWYPSDLASLAPRPLAIFAHGFGGSATDGEWLAQHLASHGYVVAAMKFPHTSLGSDMDLNDVLNQPADASQVIDAILNAEIPALAVLANQIDIARIAMMGHSYGGLTTFLASYDRELADPRISAAVLLSPGGGDFIEPAFFHRKHIPMLLLHGDLDLLVELQSTSINAYNIAPVPKVMASMFGGSHLGFGSFDSYGFNPDHLACMLAGKTFQYDESAVHFHRDLKDRVPDTGIGDYSAPPPCQFEVPDTPLMSSARQRYLSEQMILPFLNQSLSIGPDTGTEKLSAFLVELDQQHDNIKLDIAL